MVNEIIFSMIVILGLVVYVFLMLRVMAWWHDRSIIIEEENHVKNCPVCNGEEERRKRDEQLQL